MKLRFFDKETQQEFEGKAFANITYDDGRVIPIEIKEAKAEALGKTIDANNDYKISVTAYSEDIFVEDADNKHNEGVHATISVNMLWSDAFGTNNILKEASGFIDNMSNSPVAWARYRCGETGYQNNQETGSAYPSFSVSPYIEGLSLFATYAVRFEGTHFQLNVGVSNI